MAKVRITWLGHAAFHVQLPDGAVLLIDPWLDNPKFPKGFTVDRADLILLTHGHSDHIGDVVGLAKRLDCPVGAIYELGVWLESKGVDKRIPFNKGGSQSALGCRISMTHAQHSSLIEDGDAWVYAGEPAGYVVRVPDGRAFYHAGDTNLFSDMQLIRRLYRPDLAMLPIGDVFTMDPEQAAIACEFLEPKQVLPMHYGTFPALTGKPEKLRELLADRPGVEVLAPPPGETLEW